MTGKSWIVIAGIAGLLAVVLGAFGAHGIESQIPKIYSESDLPELDDKDGQSLEPQIRLDNLHREKLETWKTGVKYHMFHVVAIFAVGFVRVLFPENAGKLLNAAGVCFLIGILLFSFSLYILVVTKISILGMVAAIGGVFQLAGWVCFVFAAAKLKDRVS